MSEEAAFAAFAEAGLWPGLGRTLAAALAAGGIRRPTDVSAAALARLPSVGTTRADRLFSAFHDAAEAYAVAELLVGAGLPVRPAGRLSSALGVGAAETLRENPWRVLTADEPTLGLAEADRLAAGLGIDDPLLRGRAVLGWLLGRAAREGHTALTQPELFRRAARA
ncbi:MAG: helix-hairpin-helix domain-containing protein, partial [Mycobacteriales bacterium]